jgi:hypothetical protein
LIYSLPRRRAGCGLGRSGSVQQPSRIEHAQHGLEGVVGTNLAESRRLVAEGRDKIRRQQAHIARLAAGHDAGDLKRARELLDILREGQKMAEHYLSMLEQDAGRNGR